jgi:tyrosine-protein phosphatase SIW14
VSARVRRYGVRPGLTATLALAAAVVAAGAPAFAAEIPHFTQVSPGLYRGGRPSEGDVAALREMGVNTILDLEGGLFVAETAPVERERHWAAAAGIDFEHVPLGPLGAPRADRFDAALAVLTDPNRRPVFVHCHAGVDRTGFVVAAYRVKVEGWTPEQAYEEMVRLGFHSSLFWWKEAFFRYAAEAEPGRESTGPSDDLYGPRTAYVGER